MTFDFVSVLHTHTHTHTHLLLMLRYFCVYSLFIMLENVLFMNLKFLFVYIYYWLILNLYFFITYAFLLMFSICADNFSSLLLLGTIGVLENMRLILPIPAISEKFTHLTTFCSLFLIFFKINELNHNNMHIK